MSTDEAERIRQSYGRRSMRYEPWDPWVVLTRQELDRALISCLVDMEMFPASSRSVLDVGCGAGANLQFFLRMGFQPENLVGIDLIAARVERARKMLPQGVTVLLGDAAGIDLGGRQFDVVFQSLVFSSILDDASQVSLAHSMWRTVKPGGAVVWYDFTWDNPRNPDVRGVTNSRVRELFPAAMLASRRLTLAPPIARGICKWWPGGYHWLNRVPVLRTHLLVQLKKPALATGH